LDLPKEIRDKLVWLFVLAPGFVSMTVLGQIIDLGQLSEFQITYYSLVLTVVDLSVAFALLWMLGWIIRWFRRPWSWSSSVWLGTGILIGGVVGAALGLAAERDAFFVTLRSLPVTKELNKRSSTRPTPFLLSQNSQGKLREDGDGRPTKTTEAWVLITLKSGNKRYEGWPEFYGLGKERSEIFLSPACEIVSRGGKDQHSKLGGPGVILYEDEIQSIALLERACSPCYLRWFPQPVPKEMVDACAR
jgi:hypothetical protein